MNGQIKLLEMKIFSPYYINDLIIIELWIFTMHNAIDVTLEMQQILFALCKNDAII